MDPSLILNVVFGFATVGSLFVAIRESKAKKEYREMYRIHCQTRCRSLIEIAKDLSEGSYNACRIVRACSAAALLNSATKCAHMPPLTGHVYSIRTATNQLISFCRTLNDEYQHEFRAPVLADFENELPSRMCQEMDEAESRASQST